VTGTGCISQHTVQHVGETDLVFLSPNGVQSLKRVTQERSNPITNLTKYVRDYMLQQLLFEDIAEIRSAYNPLYGFYLLSFPTSETVWCLDQRRRYADVDGEECAVVTNWDLSLTAMASFASHNLYVSRTAGVVGQYTGVDDEGDNYRLTYYSPWLDLGEEVANRIKSLKRLGAILFISGATTVMFKCWADFQDDFVIVQKELEGDGLAEWGESEWGDDEWSGGLALRILKLPARKRGQYFRLGIEAQVSGELAIQQAELFAKIGRLA
jgi:hypothetical protein